jgi:hypothetical protein
MIYAVIVLALVILYYKYSQYTLIQAVYKRGEFVDFFVDEIAENDKLDEAFKTLILYKIDATMDSHMLPKAIFALIYLPFFEKESYETYLVQQKEMTNTKEKEMLYNKSNIYFTKANFIRAPHWYILFGIFCLMALFFILLIYIIKNKALHFSRIIFPINIDNNFRPKHC